MSIKAETSFSLKDSLFNAETLGLLSTGLARAQKGFRRKQFERRVLERFPELELKDRIHWMVTVLEAHLPAKLPAALDLLERALPPPLDPKLTDDDFGRYIWVVPGEYAARHGCARTHLPRSLGFLRESTKRFSAESAIRPFLRDFPGETLDFVTDCATDANYHVRRLASEGIRPLLPWAERVQLPPRKIVAVLDMLHADPTRYVTRSVANTLNDISKDDPTLVVRTLERWQRARRQKPAELDWITRHALRTLAKRDEPQALELLGYPTTPDVRISKLRVPKRVAVGETLVYGFELTSNAQQNLLVTARIHFRKANGSLAPKVFTVKKAAFAPGETVTLEKKQPFRPMTTRVMYPGAHEIEIVVNGRSLAKAAFELVS